MRWQGFSLLETMVALALLALSFTSLILVQGRATRLAVQARNISIATGLARYQLHACKREVAKNIAAVSDFKDDGDFSELGQPDFKWECHSPKFNMKPPTASQIEESFKDKAKDAAKKDLGTTSSISAPFITMITDSLGNAVREVAVIVRWTTNNVEDELRVVTHVIDPGPMSALSRVLGEGVKTFEKTFNKKKENKEEKPPMDGPPPNEPPPPGERRGGPK